MGKLYNGSLYDAFGGKIADVEETIWAGDSFNRDSTIAYACATPATLTASCTVNKDLLDSFTYATGTVANVEGPTLAASKGGITISSKTDELEKRLHDLENMIRSGKKYIPHKQEQVEFSFRDGLKTLHYKREIE